MRTSSLVLVFLVAAVSCVAAQVLSPSEIKDQAMRHLQTQHLNDLRAIATDLNQHPFPYHFYFSRTLDIEEDKQTQVDQRSIRFERYDKQTALEITGNYYASYSAERLDADRRVRQTYIDVILPILQVATSRLESESEIEVFAIEVSHHVRKKVNNVSAEFPENVVIVVPRDLASRVIRTRDLTVQQNLMLEAEVYQDGEPTLLWLVGEKPLMAEDRPRSAKEKREVASLEPSVQSGPASTVEYRQPGAIFPAAVAAKVPTELRASPLHDSSPESLRALQEKYQDALSKMVNEMNATAHFVSYAPPIFITFKQGAYLQISLTTTLDSSAAGSQYKLAALAFDHHVAHLLRPALGYFGQNPGFDGINFATTVKISGDKASMYSEAVEFVLPFTSLQCYLQYDCTGQQVLNTGFILINGERVGLELQAAESGTPR